MTNWKSERRFWSGNLSVLSSFFQIKLKVEPERDTPVQMTRKYKLSQSMLLLS